MLIYNLVAKMIEVSKRGIRSLGVMRLENILLKYLIVLYNIRVRTYNILTSRQ